MQRFPGGMRTIYSRTDLKNTLNTIDKLLDQFVHVADVDHLGIGADFDGIGQVIEGLEDVTGLPRLIEGLAERGFSREEIAKITHKNFIRVLEKVLPAT